MNAAVENLTGVQHFFPFLQIPMRARSTSSSRSSPVRRGRSITPPSLTRRSGSSALKQRCRPRRRKQTHEQGDASDAGYDDERDGASPALSELEGNPNGRSGTSGITCDWPENPEDHIKIDLIYQFISELTENISKILYCTARIYYSCTNTP